MRLAEQFDYIRFPLQDWELIRDELIESHRGMNFNSPRDTKLRDWTLENFGRLYSTVQKIFKPMGISVTRSRYFFYSPFTRIDPHCDGTMPNDEYWALNIPVMVPEGEHYVDFYEYLGELNVTSNPEYTDFILPKEPDKLVYKYNLVLKEPYLIKVGKFHGIRNLSYENRLILTLRLNIPDIDYLLQYARFLSPR